MSDGEGIEELKRWIAHQDAALRLDAYRDDRHGVDFWNAYLAFRQGGFRDFPEPFLKKLDLMVRLMLKAETNEEVCDAVELRRPIGGGPSGAKKAVWSAEARRQRAVIWAEHLKLAGETYRRDAPVPARLKRGTYEAAMKRLAYEPCAPAFCGLKDLCPKRTRGSNRCRAAEVTADQRTVIEHFDARRRDGKEPPRFGLKNLRLFDQWTGNPESICRRVRFRTVKYAEW